MVRSSKEKDCSKTSSNGLEQTKENVFKQYNDVDRKTVWEILEVQEEINHVNERMERLTHQKVAIQRKKWSKSSKS